MSNDSKEQLIAFDGREYRPISSKKFRDGIIGKTMEIALQELIEQCPDIIPGRQIDFENPPAFILLSREVSVKDWSLDFLMGDQFGVPTLIEAKLFQNHEARRAVIGQILDYAANARAFWSEGRIKQLSGTFWRAKDKNIDSMLMEKFQDSLESAEEYWEMLEENLKNNKLRLIIAADELRPEAKRIIEFLNEITTEGIEFLGLEVRCFGEDNNCIFAPSIIGQTQAIADKKEGGSSRWEIGGLIDYFSSDEYSDEYEENEENIRPGKRLVQILNDPELRPAIKGTANEDESFYIYYPNKKVMFTIYWDGCVIAYYNIKDRFGGDKKARDKFIKDMKDAGLKINPDVAGSGPNVCFIHELTDDQFADFISLCKKYGWKE